MNKKFLSLLLTGTLLFWNCSAAKRRIKNSFVASIIVASGSALLVGGVVVLGKFLLSSHAKLADNSNEQPKSDTESENNRKTNAYSGSSASTSTNEPKLIETYKLKEELTIEIRKGDVKDYSNIDMITNAANTGLNAGGGICGGIFNADGLDELTKEIKEKYPNGCQIGEVKVTGTHNLQKKGIKYIAHGVAPTKHKTDGEEKLKYNQNFLKNVYQNTLLAANEKNCKSLLLCLYGAGIYGWSAEESAKALIKVLQGEFFGKNNTNLKRIVVNCFNDEEVEIVKLLFDEKFTIK